MPRRGQEDIRTERVSASPTAALRREDPFGIGIPLLPIRLGHLASLASHQELDNLPSAIYSHCRWRPGQPPAPAGEDAGEPLQSHVANRL